MCTNAFAASVKQFCSFKNDVTNLAARNESATTICREMLTKINRSQFCSLKKVALHLPKPVFTHGQLYVALSRCTSDTGVKIFIDSSNEQYILDNGDFTTKNPVFYEIL